MNGQEFYRSVTSKAKELLINPLLLLSGIEGLYTFKDVPLNTINYQFLDSLILTILALRIGDEFHNIAEKNLGSTNEAIMQSAALELRILTPEEIATSTNTYLQSFASLLNGKSVIRRYHEKALDAAALEVRKAQINFSNNSIGSIILEICKHDQNNSLGLSSLFNPL